MNPDPMDVRLTSHALGELSPEEARLLERQLREDPAARERVEETRALSEMLIFGFACEEAELTPERRRQVLDRRGSMLCHPAREARLSALVLGELRPVQAAAIRARLSTDAPSRQLAEELQEVAQELRAAFATQPADRLTSSQRFRILNAAAAVPPPRPRPSRSRQSPPGRPVWPQRMRLTLSAAAVLLTGAFFAGSQWGGPARQQRAETPPAAPGNTPAGDRQSEFARLLLEETSRRWAFPSLPLALVEAEEPAAAALEAPEAPAQLLPPSARPSVSLESLQLQEPLPMALQIEASTRPASGAGRYSLTWGTQGPAAAAGLPWPHLTGEYFFPAARMPQAWMPSGLGQDSFSLARRCVRDYATVPPPELVRAEEFVNHFDYPAPVPQPGHTLSLEVDGAPCPWAPQRALVRVTVSAPPPPRTQPLRLTLVVPLVNTWESERAQFLLRQGLQSLLPSLREEDSLAILVTGLAEGVVLEPTSPRDASSITRAVEQWHQGGRRAAAEAPEAARALMRSHWEEGALNRLVVVSDGTSAPDGFSWPGEAGIERCLLHLAATAAPSFPGPVWQADSTAEAARVFREKVSRPEQVVADRCEVRVRFNSQQVQSWRPVGFDSQPATRQAPSPQRWLGGDQTTVLYEIVPAAPSQPSGAWLAVTAEYESPDGRLQRLTDEWSGPTASLRESSASCRLAAAAASFALVLRESPDSVPLRLAQIQSILPESPVDQHGLDEEFRWLLETTASARRGRR